MENEKTLKFNPEDMSKAADEHFFELVKDGKYKELISVMPLLGRYSLRNQLLILMQNPNATNVNQMRAWNYQKRHIIKGEKAMKIITPKFGQQVVTDENGNATEKKLDKITGYEVGYVYDVAQTDGEPVKDNLSATPQKNITTLSVPRCKIRRMATNLQPTTRAKTRAALFWTRSIRLFPFARIYPKRMRCLCLSVKSLWRTYWGATGATFRGLCRTIWKISMRWKQAQSPIPLQSV